MAAQPFVMAAPPRVWACVVCWRASPAQLAPLIAAVLPQVERLVLADNSAHEDAGLRVLMDANVIHLPMGANLGTAGAMNAAWRLALDAGADAVVSFDQDSHPGAGMVAQLMCTLAGAAGQANPLAAVGPAWRDARTGRQMRILAPVRGRRRHAPPGSTGFVLADHVITSGCLIPARAYRDVGRFNESLFLDYVDIEWSQRARLLGWRVGIDMASTMPHSIGDRVFRLGGRSLMLHAPMRNYLLVRNHLLMWRLPGLSRAWLLSDLSQVIVKLLATLVMMPQRPLRLRWILRGLRDGWRGVGGPPP